MSGSGFTDWQDLGVFPAQDHDQGVPIEIRQQLVAGRIGKLLDTDSSDPDAGIAQYAVDDDGLGTLGDVHPWLFWQTQDRSGRPMGSWSMAWAGITAAGGVGGRPVTLTRGASSRRPGGSVNPNLTAESRAQKASASGVLPVANASMASDSRFTMKTPGWPGCFPTLPKGVMVMVMPATEEGSQQEVMLHADPRLFAVNASGPASHGSIVVDLQPNGVPCMDNAAPGMGGRHARLQSMMRVVVMPDELGGVAAGKGNALAWQFHRSGQDSLPGFGLIVGRGDSRKKTPVTGDKRTPGDALDTPTITGDTAPSEDAGQGGASGDASGSGGGGSLDTNPDGGQNANGGDGDSGAPAGSGSGTDGDGSATPGPTKNGAVFDPRTGTWRGPRRQFRNDPFAGAGQFGFRPSGQGVAGRGTSGGGAGATPCQHGKFTKKDAGLTNAFMAREPTFGPIHLGHASSDKHRIGEDKDGHSINSAHISTDALFYMDQDRDGPLFFEGMDYPHPLPLPGISRVHLCYDKIEQHAWIGGAKEGKFKWFAEVPYVEGGGPPDTPRVPGDPPPPTVPPPGPPTGDRKTPITPSPTEPGPGPVDPPTTPAPGEPPPADTSGGDTDGTSGGGSGPGNGFRPMAGSDGDWVHRSDPAGGAMDEPAGGQAPSGGSDELPGGRYRDEGEQGDVPRPGPLGDGDFFDPDPIPVPKSCARVTPGQGTDPTTRDGLAGGAGGGAGGHGGNNTKPSRGAAGSGGTDSVNDDHLGGYVLDGAKGMPRWGGIQHTIGNMADDDVGLYQVFHPMLETFAGMAFRPELIVTGYPSFLHNPEAHPNMLRQEEGVRPQTVAVTAWGAQDASGDWAYAVRPDASRARGGVVAGGVVFHPPQFALEDYYGLNSNVDTAAASAAAVSAVLMAPGVSIAFGKPSSDGSVASGGRLLTQNPTSGNVQIFEENGSTAITPTDASDLVDKAYVDASGSAPVTDVFGRTGNVVAVAGDYGALQVTATAGAGQDFVIPGMSLVFTGPVPPAGWGVDGPMQAAFPPPVGQIWILKA